MLLTLAWLMLFSGAAQEAAAGSIVHSSEKIGTSPVVVQDASSVVDEEHSSSKIFEPLRNRPIVIVTVTHRLPLTERVTELLRSLANHDGAAVYSGSTTSSTGLFELFEELDPLYPEKRPGESNGPHATRKSLESASLRLLTNARRPQLEMQARLFRGLAYLSCKKRRKLLIAAELALNRDEEKERKGQFGASRTSSASTRRRGYPRTNPLLNYAEAVSRRYPGTQLRMAAEEIYEMRFRDKEQEDLETAANDGLFQQFLTRGVFDGFTTEQLRLANAAMCRVLYEEMLGKLERVFNTSGGENQFLWPEEQRELSIFRGGETLKPGGIFSMITDKEFEDQIRPDTAQLVPVEQLALMSLRSSSSRKNKQSGGRAVLTEPEAASKSCSRQKLRQGQKSSRGFRNKGGSSSESTWSSRRSATSENTSRAETTSWASDSSSTFSDSEASEVITDAPSSCSPSITEGRAPDHEEENYSMQLLQELRNLRSQGDAGAKQEMEEGELLVKIRNLYWLYRAAKRLGKVDNSTGDRTSTTRRNVYKKPVVFLVGQGHADHLLRRLAAIRGLQEPYDIITQPDTHAVYTLNLFGPENITTTLAQWEKLRQAGITLQPDYMPAAEQERFHNFSWQNWYANAPPFAWTLYRKFFVEREYYPVANDLVLPHQAAVVPNIFASHVMAKGSTMQPDDGPAAHARGLQLHKLVPFARWAPAQPYDVFKLLRILAIWQEEAPGAGLQLTN
ncbi:unnamed protein product [Amoebophrya sp. A120]|nr:unnamed protein product [Amoebophrya sp. A120]|eukprot:GSA120T00014184001.1